ncbi:MULTISPECIES: LLM class flavin-dependent oxidoreductase [Spirosoma]|uniref:LLM class flavin-dependent oxidoreductase n=1 Tax=Spirosoma sordidisoli TaxID=2502893 RepID=A0A4Q2UL89_9BACT|nr:MULTISPECIES: LLM class flavin-dependent oxidoreductase [Spirosoma]RYC69472.1 LLM class flavin-dependent oxidoreductase [Spirosoma sordidisoli]
MLDQPIVPIATRTADRVCEVAWFSDLCGEDTEFLSVRDPARATFAHCRDIALAAERLGFSNLLLPTSYMPGLEVVPFAAGVAPDLQRINLLTAIRCGEMHPPMLARTLASLDHMLKGRLTINIINSDLPGYQEDAELRYQRCAETIQILRQAWTADRIEHDGPVYGKLSLSTDPIRPSQQNGGPLLYFGGTSDGAREVCAQYCDVFLMWPEKEESLYANMEDVSQRAARYGRQVDFGLRIHIIVRETEAEARAWARHIMSKFDPVRGAAMKNASQSSWSLGVRRQNELRTEADAEGFVEPLLWTDIGKARSGAGGALVGSAEQIVDKLNRYMDMGMRAFILSGYPLLDEANYVARLVLPHLPNATLSRLQGRLPELREAAQEGQ